MNEKTRTLKNTGKRHIVYGVGFGFASVGVIAIFGAIACPLCAVAAPSFLASGVLKLKQAQMIENAKDLIA